MQILDGHEMQFKLISVDVLAPYFLWMKYKITHVFNELYIDGSEGEMEKMNYTGVEVKQDTIKKHI